VVIGHQRRHRVIVPVYIPAGDGYFRHAMEILQLSLDSLVATTAGRAAITVVANGCLPSVVSLLRHYFDDGRIHQLVVNRRNWGKIDAVLSVLRGRREPMVTVSDADVLFRPGWLDAIEDIFRAFPACGFATPVPNPSLSFSYTTSTIASALIGGELRFESVVPASHLDRFCESIGRPDFFRPEHRQVQLVVRRGDAVACVGGGHFVFTLRREIADGVPRQAALAALRPLGETAWFDEPPDAMGSWRLSTTRAFAWHMGNVPEPWMREELAEARSVPVPPARDGALPPMTRPRVAAVPLLWRQRGVAFVRRWHLSKRWAAAAATASPSHA
jgi:hypothetical protein